MFRQKKLVAHFQKCSQTLQVLRYHIHVMGLTMTLKYENMLHIPSDKSLSLLIWSSLARNG